MVFEKSLTAMVKGIRANRGKEAEYVTTCIQEIQKEVASKNLATKSMAVMKLAYLTMLGYDMSWATFAVVEVMSHNKFAIKRPGYLASSMSFSDSTDVGLLTINLFKKDLGSKSQYESGMAISCLSSICNAQISRDMLGDLTAMLSSSRAYLRKKTVLCLYRVFLKDPPALRTSFPKLKERLADEDQGVLTATVNTFLELARKNARNYLSLVPQLYHILVNTTNNWLSIKLLKLFQLLCPLEPRLPAKLVEPLMSYLNTTKAQSVEFEAIRCTLRTMPEGMAITALAVEKLQVFVNSSDRNLRFLALELFKEVLEKPELKERFQTQLSDLHDQVLQSIEETDVTARNVALKLLDAIVTPAIFADTVKKLMDFSRSSSSNDEFLGTILRMGARDRYALVEDFAWYLLVLADISRNVESEHSAEVAEQFTDITVRVAAVRPYSVALALSLLDRDAATAVTTSATDEEQTPSPGSFDVCAPMIGACAWVIGEYHKDFESPAEASYLKAARALLASKQTASLEPAIQAQCIWAATKLFLGALKFTPGVVPDLRALLLEHLPGFVASTHVDVSERATLSSHLVRYLSEGSDGDAAKDLTVGSELFEEQLLPVAPGAQQGVSVPNGLDLDEPFFKEPEAPQTHFASVRADPSDPYALAATYKDDLGFLAAQDAAKQQPSPAATAGGAQSSSMFYLQSKDAAAEASGAAAGGAEAAPSKPKPLDPLEQMREKLAAARASGGGATKYEVLRDEVRAPAAAAPAAAAGGASGSGSAGGAFALPAPPEKELMELQGRLWSACFADSHVRVYACARAMNGKKPHLRVDLRCERVVDADGSDAAAVVSGVCLRLPAGVAPLEADASGVVSLVAGTLQDRSAKVKAMLGLAPFVAPIAYPLTAELEYSLARGGAADGERIVSPLEIRLPSTMFLSPCCLTEDEVATYIADNQSELLSQQAAEAVSLSMPGREADAIAGDLTDLVARCAALCHFHGIQQPGQNQNRGQKFLLVARAPEARGASALPGQEPLPEAARLICLCAGLPKDGSLDVRVTIKSCRKDVSSDVAAHLTAVFRELVEGRLRSPP